MHQRNKNSIDERLKLALEGAADGIWDWNILEDTLYFSSSWKSMLGYLKEELEDSLDSWKNNLHSDDIDRVLLEVEKHFSGETEKYEELNIVNGKLKDAQAQLIQSEKMVSIGQLTAGIAHEINNPIGFVKSNVGTIKVYLQDLIKMIDKNKNNFKNWSEIKSEYEFLVNDLDEIFDETNDGMNRVIQIVKNLKDFSHPEEAEWQFADIEKGIDSTLNIVNNELKYKAEVIKEYANIPEIECMPSELNQVFMNLLVNAAHAIESKGVITIRTGVDDRCVWVEIEDNGSGIPDSVRDRIFEPFFTTKELGKGTGLGLAISYKIIKNHAGKLDVTSTVGKGTKFRISIPIKRIRDN